MPDETENTEIEETQDEAPKEEVVDEAAAEVEEPVAEAEDAPAAEPEPAAEEPAEDAEPLAAEAEPAADAEPLAAEAEPAADDAPATGETEPAEDAAEAPAAAVSGPKLKKKPVPRSERPKKTRRTRVPSAERKTIVRLPKSEHERGRRQERQGKVVSAAGDKTIVVRVDVVKLHPRYKKVVKRSTKLHAHDELNEAKPGDIVRLVETRPLSRMKRWRLQEIVEAAK